MMPFVPSSPDWLDLKVQRLPLEDRNGLRAALTTWLRQYGQANGLPGLGTGTLEARLTRLRRIRDEPSVLLWTTPQHWAEGSGLTLRFPALQIEVSCVLVDGVLRAEGLMLADPDAPDPQEEPGAVGAIIRTPEVAFTAAVPRTSTSAALEAHFRERATDRWGGYVQALARALEAEAADAHRRQRQVSRRFTAVRPSPEPGAWTLALESNGHHSPFEEGEWVELVGADSRVVGARVLRALPAERVLDVAVESSDEPPPEGRVRPRVRDRLLEQKRALVRQLASPTGDLANLVRLVAAPEHALPPHPASGLRSVNTNVGRNPAQMRAVQLALGLDDGQALLIQGPPGTGKSTTAAEINLQLLRRDPTVRILVCSHSNHGTDNLLVRLLPFLPDARERIARVGSLERVAAAARPYYVRGEADIATRNVVFTTIDSLGLQQIAGARLYDLVILDEANRAGVVDSLLALARGRRAVMIGDTRQLQPVLTGAVEDLARTISAANALDANVIDTSLFAWLMERGFPAEAIVFLDEQNRMHPAIAAVVSDTFYGGRVRTGPGAPREAATTSLIPTAVTWIDTATLDASAEERRGTSLVNVGEAKVVAALTRHLADEAPASLSIGVIAAYAEQRNLVRTEIDPEQIPAERALEIDTVDAFEGREKDIIICSLVRSNQRGEVGFLRLEQRLNVALSRARRGLVIVGDRRTLRGGYFDALQAAVNARGTVLDAAAVKLGVVR